MFNFKRFVVVLIGLLTCCAIDYRADSFVITNLVFTNVRFSGTFIITGPTFTLPLIPSPIVSITSPFTFSGHLFGCPTSCVTNFPVFSVDLIGSGLATVDLRFGGSFDNQGHPIYSLDQVTYEFEVPEPVSMVLLGGGLAALATHLKLNRRRR